eukprot:scaffold35428_cov48-Phaeocystis_antarctica.AAC.3
MRSTLDAALTRSVEVDGKSFERKMGRSSGAGTAGRSRYSLVMLTRARRHLATAAPCTTLK